MQCIRSIGRHQGSPHAKQHHPIPLVIHLCLLLLSGDMLQIRQLLHPRKLPADIAVLVQFKVRILRHLNRRRDEPHPRRYHGKGRIEPRCTDQISSSVCGCKRKCSRRIRWRRRRDIWPLPAHARLVRMHGRRNKLMRVVISWLGRVVVDVHLFRRTILFLALGFLFADAMHAGAWIDVVVDGPIRALPTIRQRTGYFLEAWVQGQIVPHRVLGYD